MKKLGLIMSVICLLSAVSHAAPVYDGAEGYITMPTVNVPDKGRLGISLKYTTGNILTPAVNLVPFKNFELGVGWDLDFDTADMNPLLLSAKLQFVPQAAFGFKAELGMESYQRNYFSVYLAWVEQLKAGGVVDSTATFAFGYTFDRGSDINFYLGFQRNIFIPKLYLIGDISNFPYRFQGAAGGSGGHLNENRGIVNLGLRLILTDNFSLDLAGLDLMDGSRQLMLGGNLYLGLWN